MVVPNGKVKVNNTKNFAAAIDSLHMITSFCPAFRTHPSVPVGNPNQISSYTLQTLQIMGKHNKEPEMTRLEELELQRGLKDLVRGNKPLRSLILCFFLTSTEYISTLYPSPNGIAILIGRHAAAIPSGQLNRGGREEFVMIHAITYLDADKATWKMVAQSSKAQYGITSALQEFSKDLERAMANMADNGSKRKRSGLFGEDDYYDEMREKRLKE
jgi:hypothetical protein